MKVYIIIEYLDNHISDVSAFSTKNKALINAKQQAEVYGFKDLGDGHWTSEDGEDEILLYEVTVI